MKRTRSSTCVLRRELIVDAAIFPVVRSCRYGATCPGKASSWRRAAAFAAWSCWLAARAYATSPSCCDSQSQAEFVRPRAAVHPAEESGQVVGVAGQGVDRRLREVGVTTQPAAGHAYTHEHVLTEQLLQPRAQLDRLLLRGIGGHLHTAHAIRRRRPGSRRGEAGRAGLLAVQPQAPSTRAPITIGAAVRIWPERAAQVPPLTVARVPIRVLITVILPGRTSRGLGC